MYLDIKTPPLVRNATRQIIPLMAQYPKLGGVRGRQERGDKGEREERVYG
jgi:hypothetical protein